MKRRMLLGLALVFALGATVMACGQCANLVDNDGGPANRPWHKFNTTVQVDARGELVQEMIQAGPPNELKDSDGIQPTLFILPVYYLECKGQRYFLELDGRAGLHELAEKWAGKTVFIKGTPKDDVITVTDMQLGQRS